MNNPFKTRLAGKIYEEMAVFSFAHYRIVLLATIVILLISLPLIKGLRINTDFVGLIDSDKSLFKTFAENKKLFGENAPLIIFLQSSDTGELNLDPLLDELGSSLSKWEDVNFLSSHRLDISRTDLAGTALRAAILNSHQANLELFLNKFDPETMSKEMKRTRRRLALVNDPALRDPISIDVLNVLPLLESFVRDRLASGEIENLFSRFGGWTPQIILIQPRGASEDSAYCMDLLIRLDRLFIKLKKKYGFADGLKVRFVGVHALTAQSTEVLNREMLIITLVSAVLVFMVLIFSLRQIRLSLICAIPLLVSIVFTLLVVRLFFNPIYFLTIGFVAIVLGLGLDIGIHLTARFKRILPDHPKEKAVSLTISECGRPIFIGIFTTVVAFASVLVTGKTGINQFAIITIIGLAMTLVVTFFLFPALVRLLITSKNQFLYRDRISKKPSRFFAFFADHRRFSFAAGIILFIISVPFARRFSLDIRVIDLFPKNGGVWEHIHELEKKLGASFTSAVQVSLDAPNLEKAMIGQRLIDEELIKLIGDGRVAFFNSPSSVLPYSVNSDSLSQASNLVESQRDTFFSLLKENRFRLTKRHLQYYDILEKSMHWPGYSTGEYRKIPECARFVAPIKKGVRLQTYVWPSRKMAGEIPFSPQSATNIAATLTLVELPENLTLGIGNTAHLLEKIQIMVKEQFLKISWIAFVLIALCVWFFFRKVNTMMKCLLPSAAAIVLMLAFIVVFDIPITPASIAFAAIVFGIGIDDAIHIMDRVRRKETGSVRELFQEIGPAITLTTISTAIGFGSLMLSSHPVVSSIGQAIAIGVMACWIFTLLFLPALITWRNPGILKHSLILILLIGSMVPIYGDQHKARKIFLKIQKKMTSTEAVSCCFIQTQFIRQMEGPVNLTGTMLFQKPHFLKLKVRGDSNADIYANRETITIIDREMNEVEKYSMDKLARSDHWMGSMLVIVDLEKLDEVFDVSVVRLGQQEILRLSPKSKQQNIRFIDLRLDGFQRVHWSRVRYENGDWVDTTFKKWKKRKKLPEREFQYEPLGRKEGQ